MRFLLAFIFSVLINWTCSLNVSFFQQKDTQTKSIIIGASLLTGFLAGLVLSLW
jgi:hypothetical protein